MVHCCLTGRTLFKMTVRKGVFLFACTAIEYFASLAAIFWFYGEARLFMGKAGLADRKIKRRLKCSWVMPKLKCDAYSYCNLFEPNCIFFCVSTYRTYGEGKYMFLADKLYVRFFKNAESRSGNRKVANRTDNGIQKQNRPDIRVSFKNKNICVNRKKVDF